MRTVRHKDIVFPFSLKVTSVHKGFFIESDSFSLLYYVVIFKPNVGLICVCPLLLSFPISLSPCLSQLPSISYFPIPKAIIHYYLHTNSTDSSTLVLGNLIQKEFCRDPQLS